MQNIILLGKQGCGKGTQAKKISEYLNIPHISTGDIFRENIKNKTDLGKKVKSIIDRGNLVSDEITFKLVEDRLNKADCKDGFILDGFPRNLNQAKLLEHFEKINHVFNIIIKDETSVERISGRRSCPKGHVYHIKYNPPKKENICDEDGQKLFQRDDDKPKEIKKRLEIFAKNYASLKEFYKNKIHEVDGEKDIEKVFSKIKKILDNN